MHEPLLELTDAVVLHRTNKDPSRQNSKKADPSFKLSLSSVSSLELGRRRIWRELKQAMRDV